MAAGTMKQRKPTATPALDADSQKSTVDAALLPGGPPGSLRVKAIAGICGIHLMACLGLTVFSATWWEDANLIRLQVLLQVIIGICCTAGAHRCFVHQAYEASMPLQLFYIFWVWASLTGSPVSWIKTHRTHHKHSDTELDPHNSHLGFWHSHFGWTFREPSNAIKREKVGVDLSCLPNLRMHQFVDRYYDPVGLALTFLIPSAVLHLSRGYINAWGMFWTTWVRLMVGINMAACVNSLAHTFGSRPHNQWIEARNNWIVSFCTWGEGWHNYHHAFPKDYRASGYDNFVLYWNPAHAFILLMGYLGLAYNLKMGCDKDDPLKAVSVAGFHYKYRFPLNLDKQHVIQKVAVDVTKASLIGGLVAPVAVVDG